MCVQGNTVWKAIKNQHCNIVSLVPPKTTLCILSSFSPQYYVNYKQGSGIAFYVSYKHFRTIYVVPMERLKIDLQHFSNTATLWYQYIVDIYIKTYQACKNGIEEYFQVHFEVSLSKTICYVRELEKKKTAL